MSTIQGEREETNRN